MSRVTGALMRLVYWFGVPGHRRALYKLLATLGPAVVVAGFLSPDAAQHWLDIAGALLLAPTGALAAVHTQHTSLNGRAE